MPKRDEVKFHAGIKTVTSTAKEPGCGVCTETGVVIETKIALMGDKITEDVCKRLIELQSEGPLTVVIAPVQRKLPA